MTVMITGATSGIGKAMALAYLRAGHTVLACGRSEQKLSELANALQNEPQLENESDREAQGESGELVPLCFDLTQPESYPVLPRGVAKLDLLILNAGDCEYIDDALHFDAKRFERVIKINLIAIGYGLSAWLSRIRSGGRVVFISSSAQLLPLPRAEAYGASKAALTYLANSLAIDLAKEDIQVTCVHPGFVATPLTDRNTFAMPMLVSAEQAAAEIIRGIARGKREIHFPRGFIWIMRMLSWLPFTWWQKLALKMVNA
ncbi:SDR family NAD(P)-dependent oxidoreductase [Shewanella sp. AS1]|uniref:SDR family NAD(P)-dependent oxidoreductase n=1 Tax=Shewanella sp. AS1 TaxID=2907626 RepID=UPI001F176752|nr:SDR family NAD(P)-dependent oxidoreductase [Shewanella sp. AS1]MCE9679482.1 SDR family NAD(P)-dependent oxidoreductase [Shewanella sp. AS1]